LERSQELLGKNILIAWLTILSHRRSSLSSGSNGKFQFLPASQVASLEEYSLLLSSAIMLHKDYLQVCS
jgi:hypothetical protein